MHDASEARGRGPIKIRYNGDADDLFRSLSRKEEKGRPDHRCEVMRARYWPGQSLAVDFFFQILASIRIPILLFFSLSSFPLRILHGVRERAAGVLRWRNGRWRASVCCSGDCRECQQECPSGSDWSFRVFSYWQRNFAKRNEFIVQLSFSLCHLCI